MGRRAIAALLAMSLVTPLRDARASATASQVPSTSGANAARLPDDQLVASLPYGTVEQVAVFFDGAHDHETLVLETRFDRADKTFALLVPVPSPPEVAKIDKPPWGALRRLYPFTRDDVGSASAKAPGAAVQDEPGIGSFTATVLAAGDRASVDAFVDAQHLALPAVSRAWVERYARMGFSFVGLRYDPVPPNGDGGDGDGDGGGGARAQRMTSATVRLSFATPVAYVPYSEPVSSPAHRRNLAAWVVSTEPLRPVARLERSIAQPWKRGVRYAATKAEASRLGLPVADAIPDADKLSVQTFEDWKTARDGWDDVVLVPATPHTLDEAAKASRRHLTGLIDLALVPAEKPAASRPAPSAAPEPEAGAAGATAPSTPLAPPAPATPSSCAIASVGAPSSTCDLAAVLAVLAALAALTTRTRRMPPARGTRGTRGTRGALLVVLAASCSKPAPPAPPSDASPPPRADASALTAPDASSALSAPDAPAPENAAERLAKEEAALDILRGALPDGGVPLLAGSAEPSPLPTLLASPTPPTSPREAPPPPLPASEPPSAAANATANVQLGPITMTPSRPGDFAQIQRTVAAYRPRFRACYARELASDPTAAGRLLVRVTLNPRGDVRTVTPITISGIPPRAVACVEQVIKASTFPPGQADSTVTLPLLFTTQ
jgi:hypothetical protein